MMLEYKSSNIKVLSEKATTTKFESSLMLLLALATQAKASFLED